MNALAAVTAGTRSSGPRLVVDLEAVAANTRLFGRRTPGTVMAVVKADGFGHGAAEVARAALDAGAGELGVTSIEEALALRSNGLTVPVLSWRNPVNAPWADAVHNDVEVAISSRDHLDALLRSTGDAQVHLHLDTWIPGWRVTERPRPVGRRCAGPRAVPSSRVGSGWSE